MKQKITWVWIIVIQCVVGLNAALGFTASGGVDVHPAGLPGYVRLNILMPNGIIDCSAVKIAPRIYLTAGHCVESPAFTAGAEMKVVNLNNRGARIVARAVAPTEIRIDDPSVNWRPKQDLAIFVIDREIREIQIADLSLVTGKLQIRHGDVFRMVGKRDVSKPVYCYADTSKASPDAFCINTKNPVEKGSIRPGDSGGPLYLVRNGRLYLAGIAIEYVEESRVYRNSWGKKMYQPVGVTQRFTRLDKGAPSKADQWVLTQVHKIKNGQFRSSGAPVLSNRNIFSSKRKRQVRRRF